MYLFLLVLLRFTFLLFLDFLYFCHVEKGPWVNTSLLFQTCLFYEKHVTNTIWFDNLLEHILTHIWVADVRPVYLWRYRVDLSRSQVICGESYYFLNLVRSFFGTINIGFQYHNTSFKSFTCMTYWPRCGYGWEFCIIIPGHRVEGHSLTPEYSKTKPSIRLRNRFTFQNAICS
jgi:hypothetical protein